MDDSTEHEEAPWRATALIDNIPIEEKDWWTRNSNFKADEKVDSSSATADSGELEKSNADKGSDAGTKDVAAADETTFHNRGLEIWEQCRDAWRSGSKESDGEEVSSRSTTSPPKPMSKKQREKVMSNVTKHREFKLPRRIRLDEMINIYTEIWCLESE